MQDLMQGMVPEHSIMALRCVTSRPMDRDLLERRLRQTEQVVCLGFELIAEQRIVVFALEAWDQDATVARQLLRNFEEMQVGHLDDFETTRVQLEAADLRMIA
jgi:hypothetical protein